jgi:hypothetical protein
MLKSLVIHVITHKLNATLSGFYFICCSLMPFVPKILQKKAYYFELKNFIVQKKFSQLKTHKNLLINVLSFNSFLPNIKNCLSHKYRKGELLCIFLINSDFYFYFFILLFL